MTNVTIAADLIPSYELMRFRLYKQRNKDHQTRKGAVGDFMNVQLMFML